VRVSENNLTGLGSFNLPREKGTHLGGPLVGFRFQRLFLVSVLIHFVLFLGFGFWLSKRDSLINAKFLASQGKVSMAVRLVPLVVSGPVRVKPKKAQEIRAEMLPGLPKSTQAHKRIQEIKVLSKALKVVHSEILPIRSIPPTILQKPVFRQPQVRPLPQTVPSSQLPFSSSDLEGVNAEVSYLKQVMPKYPPSCDHKGHQGTVIFEIEILASGRSGFITVISAPLCRHLVRAARTALEKSVFSPVVRNGIAVKAVGQVDVKFVIEKR